MKKIILLLSMILLFIPSVHAVVLWDYSTLDHRLDAYFPFDAVNDPNSNWELNKKSTNPGSYLKNASGAKRVDIAGGPYGDFGYVPAVALDRFYINDTDATFKVNTTSTKIINFFVKTNDTTLNNRPFSWVNGAGNEQIFVRNAGAPVDELQFRCYDGTNIRDATTTSSPTINDNAWHMITVICSPKSGRVRGFVDGVEVAELNNSLTEIDASDSDANWGAEDNPAGQDWQGNVDEITTWSLSNEDTYTSTVVNSEVILNWYNNKAQGPALYGATPPGPPPYITSLNITSPPRDPTPPPGLTDTNLTISTFVNTSGATTLSYFFNDSFYGNRTGIQNGTINQSFSNLTEGTWNLLVKMYNFQGVKSDTLSGILINRTWMLQGDPDQGLVISTDPTTFNVSCRGSGSDLIGAIININGSQTSNSSPISPNTWYQESISIPTIGFYLWNFSCIWSNSSEWGSYTETSGYWNFSRVAFPVNISIIDEETLFPLTDPIEVKIKNTNFSTVVENTNCTGSCVLYVAAGTSGVVKYYLEATWPGRDPEWVRQIQITINYSDISNLSTTIFMPDNDTDSTIYGNIWNLDDPSGVFNFGLIRVERYLNNTLSLIHYTNWDIELKAKTYLIGGADYIISAVNLDESESRVIGPFVPEDNLDKTLRILNIHYNPSFNLAYNDVGWNITTVGSNVVVTYNDTLNNTINVTVWIFNGSNTSDVLYQASAYTGLASFSYLTSNINQSYGVLIIANHGTYGIISGSEGIGFPDIDRLGDLEDLMPWAKGLFALVVFGLTAYGFSSRFSKIGAPVLVLEILFFDYVNWWPISIAVRSLIVLLVILARWRS